MTLFNYTYANPHFFWLLLLIPAIIAWYWFKHKKSNPEIHISSLQGFTKVGANFRVASLHSLFIFRVIAIGLLIVALARPQSTLSRQEVITEGIDIVMALDISGSMLVRDFKPDRLEAAKLITKDFIDGRPNDRIGLVIFSGVSFTQCPLTTDHNVLKNLLADIRMGMLEDGTAIGEGLATAVARLKNSDVKGKVIILVTDGINNRGSIAPLTAGEIAKTFGIRVYTIGVGTRGKALSPVAMYPNGQYIFDYVDVEIDEELLQKIAGMTGGRYFRATDNQKLAEIYSEIDKMEKTRIEVTEYRKKSEKFFYFALFGTIFLFTEILLRYTILRTVP